MLILIITTITIIVIIIIKVKLAQLVRKNTQNKKIKDFSYLIYRTVKGFTFSSGGEYGQMPTTWKTVCHNFTPPHTFFHLFKTK